MRGVTPKREDVVKKCRLIIKLRSREKGDRAASSGKTDRAPLYPLHDPLNNCLGWAVKLRRQQLIGQFGIGPAARFLHHLADKKAQQLSFTGSVLFELLGIGG
jgi:hypothetical protein